MLKQIVRVVVLVCVSAAPAMAQTTIKVDLSEFSAVDAHPVDDDGDPATPDAILFELLNTDTPDRRFQLLVGTCREDPFTVPFPITQSLVLVKHNGRSILKSLQASFFHRELLVITLDRKRCR